MLVSIFIQLCTYERLPIIDAQNDIMKTIHMELNFMVFNHKMPNLYLFCQLSSLFFLVSLSGRAQEGHLK